MKQRGIANYPGKRIAFPWTEHSIRHLLFQDYPGFNQVEVDQDFHYAHWSFIHWSCDEGL